MVMALEQRNRLKHDTGVAKTVSRYFLLDDLSTRVSIKQRATDEGLCYDPLVEQPHLN